MLRPSAAPEKELVKIEVTTQPTKVEYLVGETFDPTGMVVTGTYSDDTTEVVTDYTFEPSGALAVENDKIIITKGDFTDTVEILVTEE